MNPKKVAASIGYAALAGAVVFSCFAPNRVISARGGDLSMPGYRSVSLSGVVRDFQRSHPDFEVVPSQGKGQYGGLMEVHLGIGDRPTRVEHAHLVTAPARDFAGRPIAPHIADGRLADPLDGVFVLLIVGDAGSTHPSDLARAEALRYWGHAVTIADHTVADETLAAAFEANDVIYVSERAEWKAWLGRLAAAPIGIVVESPRLASREMHLSFDTGCMEGTTLEITDSNHAITAGFEPGPVEIFSAPVLLHRAYGGVADGGRGLGRIGDSIKPSLLTVDTGEPLRDRETAPARRVRLPWGMIHPDAEASRARRNKGDKSCREFMERLGDDVDGIDFTLLTTHGLTLLRRSIAWAASGNPGGLIGGGRRVGDVRATLAEAPSNGGISSRATFEQWFNDAASVNLAGAVDVTLYEQPDGTWVFDDARNTPYHARGGFFPADDRLFGAQGGSANNHHFTVQVAGVARYEAGRELYLKVASTAEVWVFIDGTLAIDLGGIHDRLEQRIDLDRLPLADGQLFSIDVFVAHRNEAPSSLRVETNVMVIGSGAMAADLIRPDPPTGDPQPFELAAEPNVSLSVASAEGR